MRHDDPGLEPADLLCGLAEQHEVGVVTVETAVTVHHAWVPGGPPPEGTLGPFRVRRSASRSVTSCTRGERLYMCPKFQVPGDTDLQNTPSSRDDTSDEVPKLQFKIGRVRGLVNATLLQRIPMSTMIAQLGRPNTAELSQLLQNIVIIVSAGWRTCVRLQSPVEQASHARRGLLVLVAGTFSLCQNRWGAR